MKTHRDIASLRAALDADPERAVALAPTMGNLHRGHLKLMELARRHADVVVASIFVNPMQFGAGEDFERYPRTPQQDAEALEAAGVDHLFAPDAETLYPDGLQTHTRISVPGLSEILCGAERPGHFDGVATVVGKLLLLVAPDVAVFGRKDYQQLLIIRRLVRDLGIPTRIESMPTERDDDGLALSSRNGYLSPEQRAEAPLLYRSLRDTQRRIEGGEHDYAALRAEAVETIEKSGFSVDYYEICHADNLANLAAGAPPAGEIAVLVAATIGGTRLIDNVTFGGDASK